MINKKDYPILKIEDYGETYCYKDNSKIKEITYTFYTDKCISINICAPIQEIPWVYADEVSGKVIHYDKIFHFTSTVKLKSIIDEMEQHPVYEIELEGKLEDTTKR